MDSNFNKENKVSYQELAPSLQAMLDGKANITILNNHINDNARHITNDERAKWNATLQDANTWAKNYVNGLLGDFGGQSVTLMDVVKSKLDKTEFENFKRTLARIAFTGSYNDLIDKPSGISFSDTANKALNADRATLADRATVADRATNADLAENAKRVGGIRVTIDGTAPANPENNKEIWFNTTNLTVYFYVNNQWRMTRCAVA